MKKLFLLFVLMGGLAVAQQKFLVSPNDDFIPLKKGQSAEEFFRKKLGRSLTSSNQACGNKVTFGATVDLFPPNVNHVGRHKDVMGQWYVGKATGTIDTIFWVPSPGGTIGALDSTLYVRVHRSNIGLSIGPGIRPGLYNPPCQNWGYFVNTNDLDQGVAAFPDDASDTAWHSTYNGPVSSFAPFGKGLWGFGGVPVSYHRDKVNFVAMLDIGVSLNITTGQVFFISMRIKGPQTHPSPLDDYTSWATTGFRVDKTDEFYPSRNWKFYEHDSGPANCSGIPVAQVKRGWVARGGFSLGGHTADSLDVAQLNWWYQMTVSSNIPPSIDHTDQIHNTFDTGPQSIEASISDCDLNNSAKAGVKNAKIIWFINGVGQIPITMVNFGGDSWDGTIPGQPVGTTISYKIQASDSLNLTANGTQYSYRIVQLQNPYYYLDTSATCDNFDIRSTGTSIDENSFYAPPSAQAGTNPKDDGTAGPFNVGGNMTLFGEGGLKYAWVGVNGAIALSQSASDTVDVNSNGAFTNFDFPVSLVRQGGRSDTSANGSGSMPQFFIAPYWNDHWLGDTDLTCGRVVYGNNGDSCLFIVEWDSIGAFSGASGEPTCDEATFRVILNRCDGTLEYQYDDVGAVGYDTSALVGLGGKDISQYAFVNNGYPDITRPMNGKCIKFYPASTAVTRDAWNMISIGVTPLGGDYHKTALYPTSKSDAFYYQGQYKAIGTGIMSNGPGYWLKFAGVQRVGPFGTLVMSQFDSVRVGWNMVGAIGTPVEKTAIVQSTPGMITSNYFGYGTSGYFTTSTLRPGYSYWAKSNANGTLFLNGFAPSA